MKCEVCGANVQVNNNKNTTSYYINLDQERIEKLEAENKELIDLGTDQVVTEKTLKLEVENKRLTSVLDSISSLNNNDIDRFGSRYWLRKCIEASKEVLAKVQGEENE